LPNVSFVLIVAGILIIYGEFIWVGKLIFGVTGSIAALVGLALLWRLPHTTLGISLLGASVVCFAIESAFETHWIAGISAAILWGWGFWRLCTTPSVLPQLAFPVSAVFGFVTTALLSIAQRARRNKRSI